MDYFILKQDSRYRYVPMIKHIQRKIDKKLIHEDRAHELDDLLIVHAEEKEHVNHLDIIDQQVFLVSEKMRDILAKYKEDLLFKVVCMMEKDKQTLYYLPIFEEVDCLSRETSYNMNKSAITHMVLCEEAIGRRPLFKLAYDYETYIIVRLDLAESILRRRMKGIQLIPIQVEEKE